MERPSSIDAPEPASNLTRGQLLLWTGQQLHPEAPLYNMAFAFEIDGAIDQDLFAAAFAKLLTQCDALRTVVDARDGVPRQRVIDDGSFDLPVIDFSTEPDPPTAFRAWAQTRCETLFDIDRRMFDAALAKLGDGRFAWFFNQHHVVSDAWSVAVLYERLRKIYESLRGGETAPSEPLPPYASYRHFERDARRDAEPTDHWSRYRTSAATAPLLYGHRTTGVSTHNDRVLFALGAQRCDRLRAFALQPDVRSLTLDLSMFRVFVTVMLAYLHRVSGQRSITIGAPAHNRVTHDFKESAGLFTEVYPLGVSIDDDESYRSLHDKVRTETDAFLRAAQPGGSDPAINRAVNAVVNYIRAEFRPFDGAAVRTTWLHPGHVDAEHHLRLQIHDFDASGQFTLHFDFNRDVFDAARQRDAIGHFMRVFDGMLEDREQPIGAVDLLTSAERHQVVETMRSSHTPRDPDGNVVALFQQHVRQTPDAIALVDGDDRWTYGDLDRETETIAAAIDPGSVVGVCMRRSAAAVIAMLGVLRAGATYVPMDPTWPRDRTDIVVDDAGCALVLADTAGPGPIPIVTLDALRGEAPPLTAGSAIRGEDLAYIIYTSGSTGRPKGVMIEHRALAHYVLWAHDHYDAGRRLTFPLFSPLTFDLTVTSIFVPLASGGTIVVYREDGSHADLAVQQVFDDDRVDIVKLTPSHLALVQDRDLASSRIKQLILGGEELLTPVALRIHQRFRGDVLIHNEYGPTEATVGCIVHTFDPAHDRTATVPIGTPIANMQAYVLDAARHPVPLGVVGELWVGGDGVARGYANQNELTRARFVTDDALDAGRLYRTGDLARLRPDGVMEYLGRTDDQVKIRGARVELGEVEAAIAKYPGVATCAAKIVRRVLPDVAPETIHCQRCGLASDYPGVSFDAERVCNQCRSFEDYGDKARVYFKSMDDLAAVFAAAPRDPASEYDCLALLSGGKDSTYMLCRLVDLGLRVLAFTLDNGFISDQAKGNIQRVVDALGVDLVMGSTPAMNDIFVDSLQRHANVCHGCFKTIYTLSLQLARDKRVPFIVTGLSRGQFFETRLTEDLFTELTVSVDRIDADVLETRKAYHRIDDAVHRMLDVSMFDDDRIFDEVLFVDFYRYCDVDLDALMAYLDARVPWVRPSDTGRSTNCLINDVGIYVHKHERGFHNYALPYSWDVRMGHKTRDAALEELDDDIDVAAVQRILDEIGYPDDVATLESAVRLVAYYASDAEIPTADLRRYAEATLPAAMVPSLFLRIDAIPLTANGKVDRDALPEPDTSRPAVNAVFVAARSDTERTLAGIWQDVLGIDRVGVHDNFFDLGGDSIMAIQIVARAHRAGYPCTLAELMGALTVERLAIVSPNGAAAERVVGPVDLTPVQHWFFAHQPQPAHFNHVVRLDARHDIDPARLERALAALTDHHDVLRQRFVRGDEGWHAIVEDKPAPPTVQVVDASQANAAIAKDFDLGRPPLLRAVLVQAAGEADALVLVAHHLIVDAVSWSVLLDDLSHVYDQLEEGASPSIPALTTSVQQWTASLNADAEAAEPTEIAEWTAVVTPVTAPLPLRPSSPETGTDTVRATLPPDRTATMVRETPQWRVGVDELLVTALACTIAGWTNGRDVRLFLEGHGRESNDPAHDITRTLGWFTSMYPVLLHLPPADAPGPTVRAVKEQLRRVARGGLGYGVLRWLHPDPSIRDALACPMGSHVLFNYLGRVDAGRNRDAGFRLAGPIELSRSPETRHVFAIEVNAVVVDGRLDVEWSFDRGRHARGDIETQSRHFIGHLQSLLDACANGDADAASASDFPLAGLDDSGLGKLASLLARKDDDR